LRNAPAVSPGQWNTENAPGINSTERDLNDDSGDSDGPTISLRIGRCAWHGNKIRVLNPVLALVSRIGIAGCFGNDARSFRS